MRIVILGAASGVGRAAVRLAAARGCDIVAVARSLDGVAEGARVQRVPGDVRDTAAVAGLLTGADAVLWCVGVTARSGPDVGRVALPPLLRAMDDAGVRRFVGISGAGVTLAEDRKGAGARFVSALTRRLARDTVEDKHAEHAALTASSRDWTQVRPPRLVDTPGAGAYRLTGEAPGLRAAALSKADVALAMVDLAGNREHLRAAPFLVADKSAPAPAARADGGAGLRPAEGGAG